MTQSKRHSFLEAVLNVGTGMVLAFAVSQLAHYYQKEIQLYIWKDFIWNLSVGSNIIMTSVLTVLSVARGYIWRRIFNNLQRKTCAPNELTDMNGKVFERGQRVRYKNIDNKWEETEILGALPEWGVFHYQYKPFKHVSVWNKDYLVDKEIVRSR